MITEREIEQECLKNKETVKAQFESFIAKMKLNPSMPLSLKDATTIHHSTLQNMTSTNDYKVLPYLLLHKIMMTDGNCRSCLFQASTALESDLPKDEDDINTESDAHSNTDCDTNNDAYSDINNDTHSDIDHSINNDTDNDINGDTHNDTYHGINKDAYNNTGIDNKGEDQIHPIDCLLALLLCSDDFLRQDILLKLSACQLAIPFLIPNPLDDSVTLLLWAMRSLVKGWKSKRQGEIDCRIVNYSFPIISFLRIGETQASKSNLLNALIGGESKHDFFFHWDCDGGSGKRQFVNGLVELCLYYPSGEENNQDFYPEALAFLNLRGDAQDYER